MLGGNAEEMVGSMLAAKGIQEEEATEEEIAETLASVMYEMCPEGTKPKDWDIEGLTNWAKDLTGTEDMPDLSEATHKDEVIEILKNYILEKYQARQKLFGKELTDLPA